jgi:hypothetical protein
VVGSDQMFSGRRSLTNPDPPPGNRSMSFTMGELRRPPLQRSRTQRTALRAGEAGSAGTPPLSDWPLLACRDNPCSYSSLEPARQRYLRGFNCHNNKSPGSLY